jgi:hypothetical protein
MTILLNTHPEGWPGFPLELVSYEMAPTLRHRLQKEIGDKANLVIVHRKSAGDTTPLEVISESQTEDPEAWAARCDDLFAEVKAETQARLDRGEIDLPKVKRLSQNLDQLGREARNEEYKPKTLHPPGFLMELLEHQEEPSGLSKVFIEYFTGLSSPG